MPALTRDEAAERAELITVSAYHVDLDVSAAREADDFGSATTIRFSCRQPGATTFAELRCASLVEARLNGVRLNPGALADNRLTLTGLAADNELFVRSRHAYEHTGEGMHRFTDPQDGEVYLYGLAPLDNAPRMFACFDQPDLKAPISLTVTAPPGWRVYANGAGRQSAPGRWTFVPTPPISTYLMTVVAGPYHEVRDSHDGIDLGLICRRSLATHLDADATELFTVTKGCFDRYHQLFGIRYPFGKYDQAFVPDFNAGAVENPGCVTFQEGFVFRSAVSDADRELRAVVIAHEMAHMWFGDLVTLRWWDDIWLNESFAEYMGWRVTAEATRFTSAWTSFAVGRKGQGYAADQRFSTHPVAVDDVPDVAQAMLHFDGISYAKGASVLRQLVAWLGDEAFLRGLRAYVAEHAYANATLADLLSALSAASGRDVTGWAEVWLRRAQVNTIAAEVSIGPDGRYLDVVLTQSAPAAYPTLRPHRLGIGLYQPGHAPHRVEVDLDPARDQGRTPVPALTGVAARPMLLPNDTDLTFAKIRLDPDSAAALPAVLPGIDDPVARAVAWTSAADATRDAHMSAQDFLSLVTAALPAETQVAVFADVLRFARDTAIRRYLPPARQPAALAVLAEVCAPIAAAPGPNRLTAARTLIGCATTTDLATWYADTRLPGGLDLDIELCWLALRRLVILGTAGPAEIDEMAARDTSAHGAEHAARARAAIADPAAKAAAWQHLTSQNLPLGHLVATAEGFWQPEQEALTEPYIRRYFTEMPSVTEGRTPMAVSRLATAAFPHFAVSATTIDAAQEMLRRKDLHPALRRVVVDATDDLRRALAAREFA